MEHVELAGYDPRWPDMFETEAALLHEVLPAGFILRVEHVGSTAVPGIDAKPVIDILIGVRGLDEALAIAGPLLAPHGYTYWAENPKTDRLLFIKRLPPAADRRTHHVHMTTIDGEMWECVTFRDLLRSDPSERAAYQALKRGLAERFREDRDAYTDGKSEHILAAVERAKKKFGAEPIRR